MSKIDKMSIMGIRSFDHRTPMAIQFDTPITLIVGTNGSGKTTIIECLKYMTCGELPPNAQSGRMFVHDPQMAGEKEVLAQVKMSFTSTEGVRMVATRNLQLTAKQKTRSVKALEGSIRMVKDGERNVISSRVGEMNTLLPRFLGVSRAVLENVIFCHQEDSFWPMSTPQALKEKFDEIFEAQKYTRAVENIKVLQKNYKIQLETLKNDEMHLKSKHDKSKKEKVAQNQLLEESTRLQREKESHARELQEAQEKSQEFWKKMGEAELTVGKLNGMRVARDTKLESVQSLRENLTELDNTDEELQHMLEQYEERIPQYEEDLVNQQNSFRALGTDITSTREKLVSREREEAGLLNEKEACERQIENRKKLVRETARSHNIRGFDIDIDDARAREFKDRISRKARDHEAEWDQARAEIQESLQALQNELTSLNGRKAAKLQTKESSRQNIVKHDQKINELQTKQDYIIYDEGSTVTLDAQLQDVQEQLKNAKATQQDATWEHDIATADDEIKHFKTQRERLEEELTEAVKRAGDTGRLDFLQKELKTTQRSLDSMLNAHREKLTSAVGDRWTTATMEADYQRVVQHVTAQLTEAESQRDGVVRDTEYAQAKVRQVTDELKAVREEVKNHKAAIRAALQCEPEAYQSEMQQLEQTFEDLGSDQRIYEFFTWSIKMAKEQDHCVLCKRGFKHKSGSSVNERDTMVATAEALIKRHAPNANAESELILKETQEALQAGKEASSDFENWERLTYKVIPEKEKLLAELDRQHKSLVAESEAKDAAVHEKKSSKAEIDVLLRTVQSIVKSHGETVNYERQIRDLETENDGAKSSRGMEAVQAEKKKVEDEIETHDKTRTTAVSARDKMVSRISSLELQCSQIKGRLATAEYQLKEKKSLQSQQDEYRALIAAARETIRTADVDIQDLDAQVATLQAKHDDAKRHGNDRDRTFQDTASKLSTSINRLNLADQEIQGYQDRGGDERIARCRREMENVQATLARIEAEQKEVLRMVKQLEDKVRSHEETKRGIVDNQRFRKDLVQYETLVKEIQELEKEDAEEDKKRYEKQCRRWQDRRNAAATNEANVAGQLSNIDAQIARAQADWETDYAHAGREYRRAHIKVETTKAAIDDLGRYGGALDKAIMRYHSMKMEEINRIIAELWRNTYQGTDVDTIMIRSESETVKANKSYNYRVCMVKQDVEMDMRGRCSAGQKMLASIIIRLALAECFGSNCGVIALDEPTTNLDKDNIKALAISLEQIIKFRRQQRNFQIIIITHDEDFLRQMNASEVTDKYFRVYRDRDQKSVIDMQGIAEIM